MKEEWIEVTVFDQEGYQPLIDCNEWRVAMLNYCEELEVANIRSMQKHMETDEVFVLLEGNCILFTGGQETELQEIESIVMEPCKLYNVKKGVWHTHTLDQRGKVLIVENRTTCDENSPIELLSEEQKKELEKQFQALHLTTWE